MKTITEITKKLLGQMCWGVDWYSQVNLSMSFGQPRLHVREPFDSKAKSARVREIASFRNVTVRGQWWLWIFCAYWKLTIRDSIVVTSSASQRKIKKTLQYLDGQKILDIQVNPNTGATEFAFDLGARLTTRRFEISDSEIWSLYTPNRYVLSVNSDGTYTYCRTSSGPNKTNTRPISTDLKKPARRSR